MLSPHLSCWRSPEVGIRVNEFCLSEHHPEESVAVPGALLLGGWGAAWTEELSNPGEGGSARQGSQSHTFWQLWNFSWSLCRSGVLLCQTHLPFLWGVNSDQSWCFPRGKAAWPGCVCVCFTLLLLADIWDKQNDFYTVAIQPQVPNALKLTAFVLQGMGSPILIDSMIPLLFDVGHIQLTEGCEVIAV